MCKAALALKGTKSRLANAAFFGKKRQKFSLFAENQYLCSPNTAYRLRSKATKRNKNRNQK